MLAVITHLDTCSWQSFPAQYRTFPLFALDEEVVGSVEYNIVNDDGHYEPVSHMFLEQQRLLKVTLCTEPLKNLINVKIQPIAFIDCNQ